MSDCSAPEIREAYEDIRNDSTTTDWMLITYAEGSDKVWALLEKGEGGLDALKEKLNPSFRGYGYLRVVAGDELSKRAKFVLIGFVGTEVRQVQRVKMTVHGADVKRVINQYAISVDATTPEELEIENIMASIRKAGGANYTK